MTWDRDRTWSSEDSGLDVVPHACDEYAVMLVSGQTGEIQACSATPLGRGDLSASARELTTSSEEKPVQ
jgi:hypothetical protein